MMTMQKFAQQPDDQQRDLEKFAKIYGIQLSHIFDIASISNEKPIISIEIPSGFHS